MSVKPFVRHGKISEEFYAGKLETLQYVDSIVFPRVSGGWLVDGQVLYEFPHNCMHPIGLLYNDVTYSQFYDYFNCPQISSCWSPFGQTILSNVYYVRIINAYLVLVIKVTCSAVL